MSFDRLPRNLILAMTEDEMIDLDTMFTKTLMLFEKDDREYEAKEFKKLIGMLLQERKSLRSMVEETIMAITCGTRTDSGHFRQTFGQAYLSYMYQTLGKKMPETGYKEGADDEWRQTIEAQHTEEQKNVQELLDEDIARLNRGEEN